MAIAKKNLVQRSVVGSVYLHLTRSKFAKIAIVVSAHLHVEDFGLCHLRVGNEHILEQVEHVLANAVQLCLDHLAVLVDQLEVSAALVRLSVLNSADCAPRSTSTAHRVLVRY